jgi:phage FluMu protein gp41
VASTRVSELHGLWAALNYRTCKELLLKDVFDAIRTLLQQRRLIESMYKAVVCAISPSWCGLELAASQQGCTVSDHEQRKVTFTGMCFLYTNHVLA